MHRDRIIRGAGIDLRVRDHGGHGPALLLHHGLSSSAEVWDAVAERLIDAHRVVAFDARGHGRSGDPQDGYAPERLVDDLRTVAEATGLVDPVVVGHSWGASAALAWAAREPGCRGVVCVDGGVIDLQAMGLSWEQAAELLRPPVLEGETEALLGRIRDEQRHLPWERLEPVLAEVFRVGEDGVMRRRTPIDEHMRIVRELWAHRLDDVYRKLTAPVLVVLAEGIVRDEREAAFVAAKRWGADRVAAMGRDVRISWITSAHDVPLLHPDELASEIRRFVADVVRGTEEPEPGGAPAPQR